MKQILKITLILLVCIKVNAQKDLSNFNEVDGVIVKSYWGEINIIGTDKIESDSFSISIIHTNNYKTTKLVNDSIAEYVTFKTENRKLYIESRLPQGFESIDFTLRIPKYLFVELQLIKGGNIYVNNIKNGIEVNILNGSIKLENIGKYALVNAANGEIDIHFDKIDRTKPISLITMNGGIKVYLPKNIKRNVRLISRKNGYIESDFKLTTKEPIINLNVKEYSKKPILNTVSINGGGSLLFLSTGNGPISINKNLN